MKLSYLIPTTQYEFFQELIEPLQNHGIEVIVNDILDETDVILVGILPQTPEWFGPILSSNKPYIFWHWDWYSFVNTNEPRWSQFFTMLPNSLDIWCGSYDTARQLKERMGLDSTVVTAWVNLEELDKLPRLSTDLSKRNIMYAAGSSSLGKRTDWAVKACELLDIKLELVHGQKLPRADYLQKLSGCSAYLCTAFEESNGTIPAMEAAVLCKPVVITDLPSSREVFGPDGALYFQPASFEDLKDKLISCMRGDGKVCAGRISKFFSLEVVSNRIVKILRGIANANCL